jgi:hypothetical protein
MIEEARVAPGSQAGNSGGWMLEHLGWTELLQRWSGEAIAHAGAVCLEVTPEMRASGWIGVPSASAADIAAARARLEGSLPRSYQAFLALTDGWPVLSFDFGQVRPAAGLDGCLMLSSGTDRFLYDTGRPGADGEWATRSWTSWYPGAGDQQPSFRAGLESHYASFVRFDAPDSVTASGCWPPPAGPASR